MARLLEAVKQKSVANARKDEEEPGLTKIIPEEKLREFDLVSSFQWSPLFTQNKELTAFAAGA